ncbi:MAG: Trk system potassium transporter TrkA [Hungatella sp.]|nr:Trk system potassium transporter TrkA [Hungatella sp.]
MKIIIVGCGKVGVTIAGELNEEGHEITVIDQDEEAIKNVTGSFDVIGIKGNGAIYNVQVEAGIAEADLLIATTNSDELNILCCLIAKKAGDCHTIARIRNPEYSEEVNYIREELNLSLAINPELATAREIARLLKFPSAIKIDTFAKGRVEIMKFQIPDDSVLHGIKVYEIAQKTHSNVLVCAVERGDDVLIPNGMFELSAKDKISFIGSQTESSKFFRAAGVKNNSAKSVMMIGGGKITYYLAKMLKDTPIKITIVEKEKENCEMLSADLPYAMIIHGDASDQQLLLEEGLRQTEAFAALTGFDEENIMLSLYASSQSKAKLITKVNRISFEDVINSLNLGSVINPKLITADLILQYVRAMQNSLGSNVETLYKMANHAEALEFRVGRDFPMAGVPLEKMTLKLNLLVACINRKGKIITPRGKDTIEVQDTVVIVTTNKGLNDLKDILL